MKNLFTRLRSWHTANRKYEGFVMMELHRELKKSAFDCLFFGDANGDPKDVYAGIFGGEDFSSTENKANQP